jgi:hypothetical protein
MAVPGRESPLQSETPQGTLDMLVLRVLVMGVAHGHTVAHAIERGSGLPSSCGCSCVKGLTMAALGAVTAE